MTDSRESDVVPEDDVVVDVVVIVDPIVHGPRLGPGGLFGPLEGNAGVRSDPLGPLDGVADATDPNDDAMLAKPMKW